MFVLTDDWSYDDHGVCQATLPACNQVHMVSYSHCLGCQASLHQGVPHATTAQYGILLDHNGIALEHFTSSCGFNTIHRG
jgi:hypothetical protein